MQVLILCGGKGTRAYPFTDHIPKPMLPICGTPILLHVMRIFAQQGHREFILSVGYRKEIIEDYFHRKELEWDVQLVDTGEDADTGDRVAGCRHLLRDTFFASYADGLANVNLDALLSFHRGHGGLATITSVPLVSQYGTLCLDGGSRVTAFLEKPVLRDHWINAGFFVFDPAVFGHWEGHSLEREVFPALAARQLLFAHPHDGFFRSLDSYKDQQEIEEMARLGDLRWDPPKRARR
jgi:glucose-1-phosphate cytidylyltransferase